jgi:monothiol glutaredoxin
MPNATHERISQILHQHPVVLFMKGTPDQPRCGFSARVVDVLHALAPEFHGVDVLTDEDLRSGIKTYGNWPTIPQLYVKGELVGGCDIIMQLQNSGQLHTLLGVTAPVRPEPTLSLSPAAASAIRAGMQDSPELCLHLRIDAKWHAHFHLAPAEGHEISARAEGIDILMDIATAQRADGLKIDWVETMQGAGLSIVNPNAPPAVKPLSVKELALAIQSKHAPVIVDVRPEHDRVRAPFPSAVEILNQTSAARLEQLPKDQPLAFLCHFGNSSKQAAEHFRSLGFSELFNVEGGIDAYAREIDSAVVRY